ncbi:MAG: GntR family transcriptional regulator [Thermomicrobiales bacterium]
MGKLEHYTLNERVYRRLREIVISGTIPLGARLDEISLAGELGVSRTPLREAIGRLTQEGLVEYRPYRGNFVRGFTVTRLNDLYEVRKVLEALAIRTAVAKLSDQQLDTLRAILGDVDTALARGDLTAYSAADRRFHAAIADFSGNEILIQSLNRLTDQIQVARVMANRDPHVVERTAHERPRILAALASRDADAAAALMEEHIEGVRRAVVEQFDALKRTEIED